MSMLMPSAASTASTSIAPATAARSRTSWSLALQAWFNRTFILDFSELDHLDLGDPAEFEAHVAGMFTPGSYVPAD